MACCLPTPSHSRNQCWNIINLILFDYWSTHLGAILLEVLKISIRKMGLNVTLFKISSHLPGANYLTRSIFSQIFAKEEALILDVPYSWTGVQHVPGPAGNCGIGRITCSGCVWWQCEDCPSWSNASQGSRPERESKAYFDGLVQERRNSSALAMELRLSCTDPSIWWENWGWFGNDKARTQTRINLP